MNQEMDLTPEKRQKPDKVIKTQILSTTPPTIGPNSKSRIFKPSKTGQINRGTIQIQITTKKNQNNLYNSTPRKNIQQKSQATLKLQHLSSYLRSHQAIEKTEILRILNLQNPHLSHSYSYEQLILKELSQKVQKLLEENRNLKANHLHSQTYILQNNKLKDILVERDKLLQQNRFLRDKLSHHQQEIQALRNDLSHRLNTNVNNSKSLQEIKQYQRQLNSKVFEFNLALKNKQQSLMKYINILEGRTIKAEKIIEQIKLARQFSFNSNIRKSKNYSQFSPKPVGDNDKIEKDEVVQFVDYRFDKEIRDLKKAQSVLLNEDNVLQIKILQLQKQIKTLKLYSEELKYENNRIINENNRIINENNRIIDENNRIINDKNKQLSNSIEKMKIHDQTTNYYRKQNEMLKDQNNKLNLQLNNKIERILILENSLSKNGSSIKPKNYSSNVKQIKDSLAAVKPTTLQSQNQLNQIIKQNHQMTIKIQSSINFEQNNIQLQKQIQKNQKRTHELEQGVYKYQKENASLKKHLQEYQQELQKLKQKSIQQDLRFIQERKTLQNQNLLEWQKLIKNTIQQSVDKLGRLQQQISHDYI